VKAIQYIIKQLRYKNYEPFVFLGKSITQAVIVIDIVGFLLFIGTVAINLRLFAYWLYLLFIVGYTYCLLVPKWPYTLQLQFVRRLILLIKLVCQSI